MQSRRQICFQLMANCRARKAEQPTATTGQQQLSNCQWEQLTVQAFAWLCKNKEQTKRFGNIAECVAVNGPKCPKCA